MKPWTRFEDWTIVVLAAYLFCVPFVAKSNTAMSWNTYITSLLIVVIALAALALPRARWTEWINIILGAWMIVAPFALIPDALGGGMAINAYVIGGLVLILGAIALRRINHSPRQNAPQTVDAQRR